MPARKRPGLSENTRTRIQTTQLVNRLHNHAMGKIDLKVSQIKAIEVLLRKSLPDLAAVHITDQGTTKTLDEWLAELSNPKA